MPEGRVDAVIGVDTHRDRHAAAILDHNGGLVAELGLGKREGKGKDRPEERPVV
jgi:hypothetical protein